MARLVPRRLAGDREGAEMNRHDAGCPTKPNEATKQEPGAVEAWLQKQPLPLMELRELDPRSLFDAEEWGGCGCMEEADS